MDAFPEKTIDMSKNPSDLKVVSSENFNEHRLKTLLSISI
jgi:hypothetical protein